MEEFESKHNYYIVTSVEKVKAFNVEYLKQLMKSPLFDPSFHHNYLLHWYMKEKNKEMVIYLAMDDRVKEKVQNVKYDNGLDILLR